MKPKLATVQISFGGVLLSIISHNFHGCVFFVFVFFMDVLIVKE